MQQSTVQVAVVGCGAQGRNHLRAFRKLAGVDVVAVCDTDPSRVRAAADEFGVPAAHVDYRELLAGGQYDLVSICTMPVSHSEMVIASFSAGANVLCEKPIAMDADEAVAMVRAARHAGRFLTLGFNMRFMPNAQFLKSFVDGGRLGQPVCARAWTFATDIPWWGKHYIGAISAGGVLASTAVHILDLTLWVMGYPRPVTASASMARVFPRKRGDTAPSPEAAASFDVEDTVSGHVRFADGTWLTIEGEWSSDRPEYSYAFELVGDAATVRSAPLRVVREQNGQPVEATPVGFDQHTGMEGWLESIEAEIANVVMAVREGSPPLVTAEQALTVQAIVDALYRSARTGREAAVRLPPDVDG